MTVRIRHPACALLRKLISPYGYGTKDALGYHRPTNKALVDDYNTRGYIRGLTNAQMMDHFEGRSTLYFWADGRIRTPRALICIDIDCHKFGSLAAALIFAKYLADTLFPGLYFEPSTNGKGVHAYLIIDKRGFGDLYLHGLCRLLDETLKVVHREWQAGNPHLPVEGVEIKGHPPRIEWTRDGRIDEFTSGQFVKLPREMLSRFDEFARTTVLDDRRINDLYRRQGSSRHPGDARLTTGRQGQVAHGLRGQAGRPGPVGRLPDPRAGAAAPTHQDQRQGGGHRRGHGGLPADPRGLHQRHERGRFAAHGQDPRELGSPPRERRRAAPVGREAVHRPAESPVAGGATGLGGLSLHSRIAEPDRRGSGGEVASLGVADAEDRGCQMPDPAGCREPGES